MVRASTIEAGARPITAVAPLLFHVGTFAPGLLVVVYGKSMLTQLTDAGTPLPHFSSAAAVCPHSFHQITAAGKLARTCRTVFCSTFPMLTPSLSG